MNTYRWSVRLKLGLIVFAGVIALASLWYTQQLVDRLQEREQAIVQLWADAQAQLASAQQQTGNPYQRELQSLAAYVREGAALSSAQRTQLLRAIQWAQSMPPAGEVNFILNEILEPNAFAIPAIITNASGQPLFWRNVGVPPSLQSLTREDSLKALQKLRERVVAMDAAFAPIPITIQFGTPQGPAQITQYVHYDESSLVTELRWFPYVQLLFVALFIGIGYVGFSYIRRNEQSNLWVGMAREAAHQLGTPISSLMGWTQLLEANDLSAARRKEAVQEIARDIERLQRVANRFSDIGSMPKLVEQPLGPILQDTVQYMQRRVPQHAGRVRLETAIEEPLTAPVNAELFGWVIENLLKNALDALDASGGTITLRAQRQAAQIRIEVEDTGRGIARSERKSIFRPGYSTKQRGWGLGLSLAQRVINVYHEGTLALAKSHVGHGSTFRIVLPAASDG
ncbi:sensor histidine kinase [Salisaeta longa]|uniref:sensor histidine kinase n=1 Tax=Salisaeta longa TaxID=503170 RepID=UPI0003B44030|nr:HAMP domain-containing sensor histidine kinase [Salisaeta longa]